MLANLIGRRQSDRRRGYSYQCSPGSSCSDASALSCSPDPNDDNVAVGQREIMAWCDDLAWHQAARRHRRRATSPSCRCRCLPPGLPPHRGDTDAAPRCFDPRGHCRGFLFLFSFIVSIYLIHCFFVRCILIKLCMIFFVVEVNVQGFFFMLIEGSSKALEQYRAVQFEHRSLGVHYLKNKLMNETTEGSRSVLRQMM